MNMLESRFALKLSVSLHLATPLMLRSGQTGDFTDSTIERTPDDRLHVNGYVWASLIRRSLARLSGGEELAVTVGKYQEGGVSPLWCDTTVADLHGTAATPGIRISRKYGAAEGGGLFNDELAIAGLPLTLGLTFFCKDEANAAAWQTNLLQALRVIDSGIENIGGGWGYGYGRLAVGEIRIASLDLKTVDGRKQLWGGVDAASWNLASMDEISVSKGWTVIDVRAKVAPGQLLAVKTTTFPLDRIPVGKLPDTFVFRRNRLDDQKTILTGPVIPGKAIRQALLSVPLERKWRSMGSAVCETTTHGKQRPREQWCKCPRCRIFGSTDAAGIIAVTDAPVQNATTETISRVQLCEHSMQNKNLFSGEYLNGGNFGFKVYVDHGRSQQADDVAAEVTNLLDEMKGETAPPGWYRLGGTTTCTGQVQVIDYTVTRSA